MADVAKEPFDYEQWRRVETDLSCFTFLAVYKGDSAFDEDPDRVYRYRWVFGDDAWEQGGADALTLGFVNDTFWAEHDPRKFSLTAILQGDVAAVDDLTVFADEPDLLDPAWQQRMREYDERLKANSSLTQQFTVFYDWGRGCQPGQYKRGSLFVEGIDALHAELIMRDRADPSKPDAPRVSGVVELWVPQLDSGDLDIFGTPDGRPLPPPPAPVAPRRRFWRGRNN